MGDATSIEVKSGVATVTNLACAIIEGRYGPQLSGRQKNAAR
jgi:hypothetical protein